MTLSARTIPLLAAAALITLVPVAASAESGEKHGGGLLISIDAEGRTLVRGAEVTAVSGSEIRAETSWGDTVLSWIVKTDGDTDYVTPGDRSADRDDIDEGDRVSFSGTLDDDESALTVMANVVKNWSALAIPEGRVALTGTVEDVDEDDHAFVLAGTRFGDVRVETDGDTSWKGGDDFGDIETGMKIAVSGSYDEDDETLDAAFVSLDIRAAVRGWGEHMKDWFKGNGWAFGLWKKDGTHGDE
jgi:hypothetical protein